MPKYPRLLLAAALSALFLLLSGCASGLIGAASTRIEFSDPESGRTLKVTLPKNYSADDFTLKIPTRSGLIAELNTTNFASDASTVIDRASVAQAQALGKLAEALNTMARVRSILPPPPPESAPAAAPESTD